MISKKPLKPCNKSGCAELVRDGAYCDKHKNDRVKQYDRYERNQESRKFYQSSNWKKVRDYIKARDDGLCQWCLKDKKITKADVVHHIIELTEDMSKALEPSNLECVCHSCHNEHHSSKG
ncbi:HNH endonuclease [Virgibacillus natechei]|nr:HNH endonuclease signature motif containing protein [Virgibacillus natechei]UZD14906.1 HNH endonuclease [Virgibacillus natechei]